MACLPLGHAAVNVFVAVELLFVVANTGCSPLTPTGPCGPAGPVCPGGPAGPRLKSSARSEKFLTFALVTALFLS